MDEIEKLYNSMQAALADGYTVAEVDAELKRRGFVGDWNDLNTRMSALARKRVGRERREALQRDPNTLGPVEGSILKAVDAITFGMLPKMAGAAASQGGYDPNAIREQVEQAGEQYSEARPIPAAAATGVGMLATAPLAGGGASSTFLRALGRGVGTGAAFGALAGAGEAEPGEELAGAVTGGARGGLFSLPFAGVGAARTLSTSRRGAARLTRAIDAEGGEDAVRRAANEAVDLGRGDVQPVAALGPYLRGEAELAATRSPSVYASQRPKMVARQADESDRLLRDVSQIFGRKEIGQEALEAARKADFDPVYEALNKTAGRITDPRIDNVLARPVVKAAYQEAINTGIIADVVESLPSFGQLNELREGLFSMARSLQSTPGGNKRRMAALFEAAREVESILEDNVDEFRAIQNAYRNASRPINVIELARLEVARTGRASPALDRASREERRLLLGEFGSPQKYRRFMRAVEQERKLAETTGQVFGGSATARRLEAGAEMRPEDIAHGIAFPMQGATNAAGRAIGRGTREATARSVAPLLFAPASQIDRVLSEIARRRTPTLIDYLMQTGAPAATGLLTGGIKDY